jgi:pantothenate kinase
MSKSEKTRKIIALSAGAAVGLSATAIVLQQAPNASSERVKLVQSALRDGAASVNLDKSARVQIAEKSKPPRNSDP